MIELGRQRTFALLWTGGLVSMIGDWALFVVLPIYVFELTHSTLATGGMFVAEMTPALLLGSVAGVFVDRWDRKRTMIVCNLILAVVLLPLIAVNSAKLVWIAFIVAAMTSTVTQFFSPAESALLPQVVAEKHLVSANSLNALSRNMARLVGPSIGGAFAAVGGISAVVVIDAASFLVAAGMIALAPVSAGAAKRRAKDSTEASSSWKAVWSQWLDGMALVRRKRLIAVIMAATAMISVGEGVFSVMFVVWVKEVIRGGALQLGWFMSAQAVGGLLGGLAVGYASRAFSPGILAGFGLLIFGLLDIVLFSYPLLFTGIWLGLALIVLVGIPVVAGGAGMTTILQTGVSEGYRGRIFGALGTTQGLFMLIGTLMASTVGGLVGPVAMLNTMQGGMHVVAGLVIVTFLGQFALQPSDTEDVPAAAKL